VRDNFFVISPKIRTLVLAGNPTTPPGAFFDAFTKERGLWNCFTISAFDTPNLEGLSLEQLLRLDVASRNYAPADPIFTYIGNLIPSAS
jgi:hypothetical protein